MNAWTAGERWPQTLWETLERSSALYPDSVAIIADDGSEATYEDVSRIAIAASNTLLDRGVRRGDRVLLQGQNSVRYVAWYYAVLRIGAVVVGLPPSTGFDEIQVFQARTEASAIIFDADLESAAVPTNGGFPITKIPMDAPLRDSPGQTRPGNVIDLDLAEIAFTSGSAGEPKGVMLTHRNLLTSARAIVEYLRIDGLDRHLCVLPFHYIFGKSLLLTHVLTGAGIALANAYVYPNEILRRLAELKCTGFSGVPTVFTMLLDRSALRDTDLRSLRYMAQAGGHLPPAYVSSMRDAIAPARFFVMYGATEAAPRLSYLDPDLIPEKPGSVGKAVPNCELRVVDEWGTPVRPGETGEIVARGSNITQGYWRDPAATAEVLVDGWYHTGDMGHADSDGDLFITGRKRDFLKVRGVRVGTRGIEDELARHPAVADVAVVGVPHPTMGEAPVAFVTENAGVTTTEAEIRAYAADRLPPEQRPERVWVRDVLPVNASGKVDKRTLHEVALGLIGTD